MITNKQQHISYLERSAAYISWLGQDPAKQEINGVVDIDVYSKNEYPDKTCDEVEEPDSSLLILS